METEEELNQLSPATGDPREVPSMETSSNEEAKQAAKVNVASKYETQSESELLALCGRHSLGDSTEEAKQASKVIVASKYETQSESELLALCGHSPDDKAGSVDRANTIESHEEASETPHIIKKTGRIKRKERRLRNEPQNIVGKHILVDSI